MGLRIAKPASDAPISKRRFPQHAYGEVLQAAETAPGRRDLPSVVVTVAMDSGWIADFRILGTFARDAKTYSQMVEWSGAPMLARGDRESA
jgi:hypothetical protein